MIEFLLGLSPGLLVASIIIAFIGLISQMSLYAKAGQPPISALVPFWNVVVFCKVVGRPAKHSLFLITPIVIIAGVIAIYWPQIDGLFPVHVQGGGLGPGPTEWSEVTIPFSIIGAASLPIIYFVIIMFIEVCDSFGKHKTIDKVLCVIFNGIYILFALGISDARYEAPWYAKTRKIPYDMPDFKHKGKKIRVDPNAPEGEQEKIVDIEETIEKSTTEPIPSEKIIDKTKAVQKRDVAKTVDKKIISEDIKAEAVQKSSTDPLKLATENIPDEKETPSKPKTNRGMSIEEIKAKYKKKK